VRSAIDDAEAIARARGGDLDAYGVLVARYTVRAHRAVFLSAREESDDVVREAFVKVFRTDLRPRRSTPELPFRRGPPRPLSGCRFSRP
jgi:DNA-directed RNA polymerase specialized sigma24 family protein